MRELAVCQIKSERVQIKMLLSFYTSVFICVHLWTY